MQANLRRDFLTSSASGIGGIALSHLLSQETFAGSPPEKNPHFSPKTKNCILTMTRTRDKFSFRDKRLYRAFRII